MSYHGLGLDPGIHPCCMYRGVAAQRDDLCGPYGTGGPRAGRPGIKR